MSNPQEGAEPNSPAPEPAGDPAQPQVGAGEAGDPVRPSAPVPPPIPPIPPISPSAWAMPPVSPQPYPGQQYQGQPYPPQYPGYPGYPGYPPMVQRRGTNGFAIAALVCGIAFNILGIVFGFVALNQIKRTGEDGRGLALAGIWVGAASLALTVVWFVFFFVTFANFMQNAPRLQ